jgi:hypothetical protein
MSLSDRFHNSMGRLCGVALVDVVGMVIIAGGVSQFVPQLKQHIGMTIVTSLVMGEFIHLLVRQETPITKLI